MLTARLLKPEVFRIKTMVEQAFLHRGRAIAREAHEGLAPRELERYCQEYRLLTLSYAEIVYNDYAPRQSLADAVVAQDTLPHHRRCDFCRADIWNTWFHCAVCYSEPPSRTRGHDFCVDCVAINRGCDHRQAFTLMCHRPIGECLADLMHFSNLFNTSPTLSQRASFVRVPEYSVEE